MRKAKQLRGKKKAMFESLRSSLGNITKSATEVGIDRTTHYLWLRKDPLYKSYIDSINDYQTDFYETALHALIKEKNVTAIIFALKCKGKHRGWIERSELSLSGEVSSNLNYTDFAEVYKELKEKKDEQTEPDTVIQEGD